MRTSSKFAPAAHELPRLSALSNEMRQHQASSRNGTIGKLSGDATATVNTYRVPAYIVNATGNSEATASAAAAAVQK